MKKCALILVFFVLLPLAGSAQEMMKDTVLVLRNLNRAEQAENPDSAYYFAIRAQQISNKLRYESGLMNSRKILAPLLMERGEVSEGLRMYFQLISELEREELFDKLYEVYFDLGTFYHKEGLFSNSNQNLQHCLSLHEAHDLNINLYPVYLMMGQNHRALENFDKAHQFFNWAYDLAKDANNLPGRVIAKRNKVETLQKQELPQKTIAQNLEIEKLLTLMGDTAALIVQWNNIGVNYEKLNNPAQATKYFEKALSAQTAKRKPDHRELPLFINLGINYFNQNRIKSSLQNLDKAEAIAKRANNQNTLAEIYDLKAMVYLTNRNREKATEFNDKTFDVAQKQKLPEKRMDALLTASLIAESGFEYEEALNFYKQYLELSDSIAFAERLKKERILQNQFQVERAEKEIRLLMATNEIKDFKIKQLELQNQNKDFLLKNQQLEALEKLQRLRIARQELENLNKERQLEILKASEENQRLQLQQKELEEESRLREIALLEQQSLNQELELEKAENQTRNLYMVTGLLFLIAILILTGLLSLRLSNRRLAESRSVIKHEKERSEHLLLNILPASTAEELKRNGKATPRRFENATVLFTDFRNFSQIASKMPPSELLEELHLFFSHFDAIVEKHGIEKIKTIGDAYMCVGGVPISVDDHAERVINAAREMLTKTLELNVEQINRGKTPWQLRLGINSGPVVAGVVGEKKFAFDIWGDTVNLAARMEQYGEINTINISENTHALVKDSVLCAYRGEVEVHNRGPVKMYRVENPVQSAILKEL